MMLADATGGRLEIRQGDRWTTKHQCRGGQSPTGREVKGGRGETLPVQSRLQQGDLLDRKKGMHKPVLERRCICDFCLEAALWAAALGAAFVLVGCATAMLAWDVLMRSSRWWWRWGGSVDICMLGAGRDSRYSVPAWRADETRVPSKGGWHYQERWPVSVGPIVGRQDFTSGMATSRGLPSPGRGPDAPVSQSAVACKTNPAGSPVVCVEGECAKEGTAPVSPTPKKQHKD